MALLYVGGLFYYLSNNEGIEWYWVVLQWFVAPVILIALFIGLFRIQDLYEQRGFNSQVQLQ